MIWTEEMDALLRKLKLAGELSYAKIAAELNHEFKPDPKLTRNAICGRIMRIGLSLPFGSVNLKRSQERRTRDQLRLKRIADEQERARQKAAQKGDGQKEKQRRRELAAQTCGIRRPMGGAVSRQDAIDYDVAAPRVRPAQWDGVSCAFPIGDPKDDDFAYCGAKAEHGPYCEHHAQRVRGDTPRRPIAPPKEENIIPS